MTYFCEKCAVLLDEAHSKCPHCRAKKIRLPKGDDIVFLTEINGLTVGLLKGLLESNRIPFIQKRVSPIANSAYFGGNTLSHFVSFRFYVHFCNYETARELVDVATSEAEIDPEEAAEAPAEPR